MSRLDEIPILIYELHENAQTSMLNEDYDKAVIMLNKAGSILQALNAENSKKDAFLLLLTTNNIAHCYQKYLLFLLP